jgi:selenide, water dikinase
MSPRALAQVLRPLKNIFDPSLHPKIIVGLDDDDDAAVYKISDDTALIHTLDFFTPIVDDPYTYGAISAANSMSDVYAMGGDVVLALNICCFPPSLDAETVSAILRGGAEKTAEAGGVIAGGHTVDDKEPKYGLSVIGHVHPDKLFTKAGAQPGDILLLTKPLGVGIITTAAKSDVAEPGHLDAAIQSMLKLNRDAADIFSQIGVHACTDITGFSFLGHAWQMAAASSVGLKITFEQMPFIDGAKQYADDWLFPGGSCNNQSFFGNHVRFSSSIPDEMRLLLFTPETSGGLLAAVEKGKHRETIRECANRGVTVYIVGEVVDDEKVIVC